MKRCVLAMLALLPTGVLLAQEPIVASTEHLQLVFAVDKGKVFQTYFGERLTDPKDVTQLPKRHEAYITAGTDNLFEPAIQALHTDGNPSLDLRYVQTERKIKDGVNTTIIRMKDPKYPFEVALHIAAYMKEDVFKTWTEIRHQEKGVVKLSNYASGMLHFDRQHYYLTQFHGDWAEEMKMQEAELTSGIKVLDTKLGTRAAMYQSPFFMLSLNELSGEKHGEVIAGALAWTGNFRFAFELDERNSLRVIAGINPYASEYPLAPNTTFETPGFVFTYSAAGRQGLSDRLHRWVARHAVLDGDKERMVLLNNWEATFFDFNESKLSTLFGEGHDLGADLFLLDDGWFANKYPRNNDAAGLGDWDVNRTKLPNGIGQLVKTAEGKGIKFGIWLEPEMVNPKSELYEKHPDWILKLPNRDEHYYRNQLVLDLVNPKVQDFVYDVVDKTLRESPGIAYIKWDCNRMITNAYSPYLKGNQATLYIDYVRGLYKVLDRVRARYPHLPMMLCSGGGARVDFGALPYFSEFWASDNTDGVERVYMQWGYSYFFPSFTVAAHVTSWGKQSLKFRTDVAMMGRLGYDIELDKLSEKELAFSRKAVATYKQLQPVIAHGSLYRLVSPYAENRAVLMYVNENRGKAVLFAYNLHTRYREDLQLVKLEGLDPAKRYRIREVNLEGEKSRLGVNDKVYSGDYLMKQGVAVSPGEALQSAVLEITAE
ncbi:alpha-galactosidase [Chitinophaga horti]|uniref:Alpha-galactosidase n=1 Tax=Chitinophaga horti TaxID=2920382 RepID=A0ABY6J6X3_9BACT|nr:alpha-galactosidase [Chitinophaga horti]UYQ94049.1 alpha-galactosidase [Chitinophaga horti]